VRDDVLSLAICKPAIRSVARKGSTILGFAGNHLYEDNCLVYAAKVTQRLDAREYFSEPQYANRPDCIYHWDGSHFKWVQGSRFHSPSSMAHDLGEPPDYIRASVLLSEGEENFRYFGDKCPVRFKKIYPHLKWLVENLGQGHRVNFEPNLLAELRCFIPRVWEAAPTYRETPVAPTGCEHKCDETDDVVAVEC
jgi:hypothetical protein